MISIAFLRRLVSVCFPFVALLFCLLGSGKVARADSYTYTLFNGPGAPGSTYLLGINDSDQLTVASNGKYFLYSNGVFTTLESFPFAINNSGDVLEQHSGSYGNGFFIYSNGTTTNLSNNGYSYLNYYGIDDADTVVGTTYNGDRGVITYNPYTSAVTTLYLPGTASFVRGVNDAGTIIVGDASFNVDGEDRSGLIEANGSLKSIQYPSPHPDFGYENTEFFAVNNSGQILGVRYGSYVTTGNFIYSNGVFTDLNLPSGYSASSINDKGQIVGTANLGAGVYEGFIATPVPQVPEIDTNSGAGAIALLAGVLLILRGRQLHS